MSETQIQGTNQSLYKQAQIVAPADYVTGVVNGETTNIPMSVIAAMTQQELATWITAQIATQVQVALGSAVHSNPSNITSDNITITSDSITVTSDAI